MGNGDIQFRETTAVEIGSDPAIDYVVASMIDPAILIERAKKVQYTVKTVMKKDVHFMQIVWNQKPVLLQAGAEKLMSVFLLRPVMPRPQVSVLRASGELVTSTVLEIEHIPTGKIIASHIGTCSTWESKYRWRESICDEEFKETPEINKRIHWKKADRKHPKPYTVKQIMTHSADQALTCDKMSFKRALVSAVRQALACSDVFDVDLEGLEHMQNAVDSESQRQLPKPRNDPKPKRRGYGTDAEVKEIFKIARNNNWTNDEIKLLMLLMFGWKGTSDIDTKHNYNKLCEHLKTNRPGDFDPEPKMDVDEDGIPF